MSTDVMEQRLADLRRRNEELDREREEASRRELPDRVKSSLRDRVARLEGQIATAEAALERRARFEAENPRFNWHGAKPRSFTLPDAEWTEGEPELMAAIFSCGQWSEAEVNMFAVEMAKLPVEVRLSLLHTIVASLVDRQETQTAELRSGTTVVMPSDVLPSERFSNVAHQMLVRVAGDTLSIFVPLAAREAIRRVEALPEGSRARAAQVAVDSLRRALLSIQGSLKVGDRKPSGKKRSPTRLREHLDADGYDAPSNAPGATSALDTEKDDVDHLEPPGFDDPMLGDFAVDSEP